MRRASHRGILSPHSKEKERPQLSRPCVKILIDADTIHRRVTELGLEITRDYACHDLVIVGVLKGSVIFLADLTRRIEIPHELGFVHASSYRGETTSAGSLSLSVEALPPVEGRDVLLLDDIFDTGRTLEGLILEIGKHRPRTLKTGTLLWKEGRSEVPISPDYHGFKIPDEFVVGYGLDYNDRFRHLPYIGIWGGDDVDDVTSA